MRRFVIVSLLRVESNSKRLTLIRSHTFAIYGTINALRNPDPEKERSERKLTLNAFLETYNEGLPEQFPLASISLLKKFQLASPKLFQDSDAWTLDKHRKQFMDWLRVYIRSNTPSNMVK